MEPDDREALKCPVCGREFKTWQGREDHVRDTGHVYFLRDRRKDAERG